MNNSDSNNQSQDLPNQPSECLAATEAVDGQSGLSHKVERLVLSIATNQFTVPLPTGKEIVNAVNSHAQLLAERDALRAALNNAIDREIERTLDALFRRTGKVEA